MRLIGIVVGGLLGLAVIAEGAYIFRTRAQLAAVTERLEAISVERDSAFARGWGAEGAAEARMRDEGTGERTDAPAPRRLPLPRLVASQAGSPTSADSRSDDPLPLPAAIDSPQAREQLRQFVL